MSLNVSLMSFFLHQGFIIFNFWINGKRNRYSTKIKVDKSEWDLKTQRPKARRGEIGEANRKMTHELNEYQKVFDDLKRYYKESLTRDIVRKKLDEHFQLAQVTKRLTYSDYFQIYIQQKKDSESVKKIPGKNTPDCTQLSCRSRKRKTKFSICLILTVLFSMI